MTNAQPVRNAHAPRRAAAAVIRPGRERGRLAVAAAGVLVAAVAWLGPGVDALAASPCSAPVDSIACENSKPGSPRSDWGVDGSGDPSIQGFTTQMSVDNGERVDFKINTPANAYRVEIYRVGYYGGDGARLVGTVTPSAPLPQTQPSCLTDMSSGLVDCGNWGVSASWDVPADAVSGVYFAHLVRSDTGGQSNIVFVVRDDQRHANMLVQTSDSTWNAYNSYGNVSLYSFNSRAPWWSGRAAKVSYNRPLITRDDQPYSTFWSAEYPMVRWLERNGYDVSYSSAIDTATRGDEIRNHRVWISSGHDEYWSAEQRANVETARGAGVNLAFFSGNEMFWKTRWEPSIDGSGTPGRTLVTYKESYGSTRQDPSGTWTGTWRDPRFGAAAEGRQPENALTGTLFTVNSRRADPIKVPAAYGRMRFWRDTGIDRLAPGEQAVLPNGVLGYEWDEDVDNGFRPPGLIGMSQTTVDLPTEYLKDYGTIFGPGTATHSLTLYRASSGALVFGAGTVQWSWGLDASHDNDGPASADPRMQQATVNLFADMGVQPASLQAGLTPAVPSTDSAAPSITIDPLQASSPIARNSEVEISGTAADVGGGIVGGIEVSTDGGATWHRAAGREQWRYRWTVDGFGPVTIKARATDDSGNIGAAASVQTTVGCPCSIWPDTAVPSTTSAADTQAYELGLKFRASVDGYIRGVRFYKGTANTGTHVGHLWSSTGTPLGEVTFRDETASGWQTASFATPIAVQQGRTYIVSYYAPRGGYALDRPGLAAGFGNTPLRALADGEDGPNAVFRSGSSGFPTQTKLASNYWVDVVFDQDSGDRVAPSIASTTPAAGSTAVPTDGPILARFDEPLDPASVTGRAGLTTASGDPVPATVTYDDAARSIVITPATRLTRGTGYRAFVSAGIRDTAGNALAAGTSWSFTTYSCPCSIWPDTASPSTAANNDTLNYELGLKFRSNTDGYVTAIRFYKGSGNTGTHLGHLWSATGAQLGEVTFRNESATGWQTASFTSPILIRANTTYIASYYAPNGRYALDRPSALASGVSSGPLRALRDGEDGPNAVFKSRASGFPTQALAGSASNYWVDLVFDDDGTDRVAPEVTATSPAAGAAGVAGNRDVTATFSEPLDPASVTSDTVTLYGPSGSVVPATVSYEGLSRVATLHPLAALNPATTYRAVVRGGAGGVRDVSGLPLASDTTWTFTTYACPCTIFPTTATPQTASHWDVGAYELGLRFRTSSAGYITGVRFYKGSANLGTHVGHLWSAAGAKLGEVTFANETATGWQTATFPARVPVEANTTYIVSYWAPRGGYALDRPSSALLAGQTNGPLRALADGEEGGNGVFKSGSSAFPTQSKALSASNYWVDAIFDTGP